VCRENTHTCGVLLEGPEEKGHLEDLGVEGVIILKQTLELGRQSMA
jgi:hypothetical protein